MVTSRRSKMPVNEIVIRGSYIVPLVNILMHDDIGLSIVAKAYEIPVYE